MVFPAQAGVFLSGRMNPEDRKGSSPRKRGCFSHDRDDLLVVTSLPRASGGVSMGEDESTRVAQVFPAQAGVFPNRAAIAGRSLCLPRASGGVSITGEFELNNNQSSPPKRGCFPFEGLACPSPQVFPAQAGVFLPVRLETLEILGLPRASGGVSRSQSDHDGSTWSSPRKRGCFRLDYPAGAVAEVFPAQAGVFRIDVAFSRASLRSSPRKRGCFPREPRRKVAVVVFPAQAGVFLSAAFSPTYSRSLPRASGGVSLIDSVPFSKGESSPRKRGCFFRRCEP